MPSRAAHLMNGSRSATPAFFRSRPSLPLPRARAVARASATANELLPKVEVSEKIPAVVSSLFGRPRWGTGSCVVPVLGPDSGLPFGLSLEIVTDDESPKSSVAQESTRGKLLDLCYVLSGDGLIEADDGSSRIVRAGDALLAWHGTTRLHKTGNEPLSVLLFHLPSHLLARSTPTQASILEPELLTQLLQNFNQRYATAEGECFTTDEAAQIMQAARVQASRGISKLYKEGDGEGEGGEASSPESSSSTSVGRDLEPALLHDMIQTMPWPGSIAELKEKLRAMLSPSQRADKPNADVRFPDVHALGSASSSSSSFPSSSSLTALPWSSSAWSNTLILPLAGLVSCPTPMAATSPSGTTTSGAGELDSSNSSSNTDKVTTDTNLTTDTSYFASSDAFDDCSSGSLLMQRAMEHFRAFRFPNQSNRLAFVFDPSEINLSVSFGIEVFEPGHKTPIHVHPNAHEVFFCLAGHGDAYCDGEHIPVSPGDVIVFPPKSKHALDNLTDSKLYCLQLMAPNEQFVEYVKSGEPIGRLSDDDLCTLANLYC